jgi:hypothetical protein
VLLWDF